LLKDIALHCSDSPLWKRGAGEILSIIHLPSRYGKLFSFKIPLHTPFAIVGNEKEQEKAILFPSAIIVA
jgi:hypothetical protein